MENKTEQPKHTRGEWATAGNTAFKTDAGRYKLQIMRGECAPLNTNIVATAFGNTKEEAEANAQRIVKAVNSFDVMISAIKKAEWELKKQGYTANSHGMNEIREALKLAHE